MKPLLAILIIFCAGGQTSFGQEGSQDPYFEELVSIMARRTTPVVSMQEKAVKIRRDMDLNVLNNTAREGCRYALVNNTSSTIVTDVKAIVTSRMGSRLANFTGLTVTVSGTHGGVATNVNDLVAGDMITVSVSGTYSFMNIIPFVSMPSSYAINSAVTMGCEGGT